MKKLKLNLASIQGAEILSREQLKSIVGGDDPGSDNCYNGCLEGYTCENGVCIVTNTNPTCDDFMEWANCTSDDGCDGNQKCVLLPYCTEWGRCV